MRETRIAWAHHTLNFWTGCNHVSAECDGCYADAMLTKYGRDFTILQETSFKTISAAAQYDAEAKAAGKTALVFTCSLSDFFHVQADRWRDAAWEDIRRHKNLTWQILTKRPERILGHLPSDWGDGYPNVMLGTTVGQKASYKRLDALRSVPCSLRFISVEPLLEDVSDINLGEIGWVLVGGMSGSLHKAKAMRLEWAASLYDKCQAEGVPYFFKQVSAFRSEQGINALGLYLAERSGLKADPAGVDLMREYPKLNLELMPVDVNLGRRFTAEQWQAYKASKLIERAELVTLI